VDGVDRLTRREECIAHPESLAAMNRIPRGWGLAASDRNVLIMTVRWAGYGQKL
jgi:hypothetical protein